MKDDWKYFLEFESKTPLMIAYNEQAGSFSVRTKCHKFSGPLLNDDATALWCGECGAEYGGSRIKENLKTWATVWSLGNVSDHMGVGSVVAEWVADWVGIPQEDLTVTVIDLVT